MSSQPFLNPNAELFRWGPIPMKFFYVSTFFEAVCNSFPREYENARWPATIFLRKDGRMVWINEYPALRSVGREVFEKYVLPTEIRHSMKKSWKHTVEQVEAMEKKIEPHLLDKLSETELAQLWNEFHQSYLRFWTPTIAPELGNYGSAPLLEEKLTPLIPEERARAVAMEALAAPEEFSFYQEEELDLATTNDLEAHQQRYFWLKNSYNGTKVLPVSFFAERKKELQSTLAQELQQKLQQTQKRKDEIIRKHNLPNEIVEIATALREALEWQDERKRHIFVILHFEDLLLEEIGKRHGYSLEELHNSWYHEIPEILAGKNLQEKLREREKGFGIEFYEGVKELNPDETTERWETFAEEKLTDTKELRGVIASQGKNPVVQGRVRIVLDPHKADSFQAGEILVAPMTSPEYVFAMKQSAAVVTDAGGLTSHAAIVSRELEIPCIVGTKVATRLLKDGDMVEVDASHGIVRKI